MTQKGLKMHKMLFVLLMICIPLLGSSAHHKESASSGAYVLTMDIKTDDLIAFSAEAEKFFESGVLQKGMQQWDSSLLLQKVQIQPL